MTQKEINSIHKTILSKPEKEKGTNETDKNTKKIVLKNVIIVGLSWIFLFTAYSSIANLQSSLNTDGGLGTASLSTIYVSLIISSIFVPSTMIKRLGVKKTIFISQLGYILYILSNIYPRYYTMMPVRINFKIFIICLII